MKILNKFFDKVIIFEIKKFKDKRGEFFETFNQRFFKKKFNFDAVSINKKNVFRGLHYQTKNQQAKIVNVLEGKIIDIIVDVRKKSKSYLSNKKIILSDKNNKCIYIPEGFAHGFFVLSKKAIISYKISKNYNKKFEKTLYWNDEKLKINLPKKLTNKIITSRKDSGIKK